MQKNGVIAIETPLITPAEKAICLFFAAQTENMGRPERVKNFLEASANIREAAGLNREKQIPISQWQSVLGRLGLDLSEFNALHRELGLDILAFHFAQASAARQASDWRYDCFMPDHVVAAHDAMRMVAGVKDGELIPTADKEIILAKIHVPKASWDAIIGDFLDLSRYYLNKSGVYHRWLVPKAP